MATKDIEERVGVVEYAVGEIKESVNKIASAVETLARVEVKHEETREAMSRAFRTLDSHEQRITAVEAALPPLKEARGWAVRGLLAIVGMVGIALLGLVLVSGRVEIKVGEVAATQAAGK